jgi:hypothetical protein
MNGLLCCAQMSEVSKRVGCRMRCMRQTSSDSTASGGGLIMLEFAWARGPGRMAEPRARRRAAVLPRDVAHASGC